MSATQVIDAAAGAAAGSTSANPNPAPAGDSGADSGALLTDESILGITESDSSASTTSTETAQPVSDTTTAAQSAAPQELSIDDFKALFKDNPKIQSLWDNFDRLKSVSSRIGTPTQIAKLADNLDLIGGVDQLAELVGDRADEEQAYSALAAGSPESRKELLSNYAQWWGPQAFADVSRIGLDVLKTAAPEEYNAVATQFFMDAFKSENVYGHVTQMQKARQANDVESLGKLVDELIEWTSQKFHPAQGQAQSLEAKRIEAERQKLAQDQKAWQERTRQEEFQRVSGEVQKTVNGSIEKILSDIKLNGRQVFGENSGKIRGKIASDIYERAWKTVNANPIVTANLVAAEARGGQGTLEILTKAFNERLLQSVATEVIGEWTQGFVGQQKAQLDRARAAAARPDAGSSVSRGERTPGKLTTKDIEKAGGYGKLSDDQILSL